MNLPCRKTFSTNNDSLVSSFSIHFLKRFYLFTFTERGREGEREGEKHQCVRDTSISCSWMYPTEDLAHYPGICPDWELNQRPFILQAGTQFTKPHQPGLDTFFYFTMLVKKSSTYLILLTAGIIVSFHLLKERF